MTYRRMCKNWIQSFRDWTIDRSQVSLDLIDWSAIFTLASVLKRRVVLDRKTAFLGSWDCNPYLYIMVVGPAGIGKTTAMRFAFELLEQIPNVTKPPTFATVEGLIDDLIKSPDSSTYLVIEEFSDIMMKDSSGKMYSFLTGMYDGKTNIRQKTMARDKEFVYKPCLNVFGGTTPEWLADNINTSTLNGGFGSRFIWLYIPELRRRRVFYRKEIEQSNFEKIGQDLVQDLNHIATELEGEFTIDEEAMDFLEKWNEELPKRVKYKKISGYVTSRKLVFVLKLAMILHVAYSDDMILNIGDFTNAITLIENLEPKLPMIFDGVGKNEYSLEAREIFKYIKENEGISEMEIKEYFKSDASPVKLHELIEGLLAAGLTRSEIGENNKRHFHIGELG